VAALAEAGRSYALLADGRTMTIRPAGPDDYGPVRQLHEAMAPDNLYFRFFSASRSSAEWEARRVCLRDDPGRVALLGVLGDEVVGSPATGDRRCRNRGGAWRWPRHAGVVSPRCCEHLFSRAQEVKVWSPMCCG
jgi:hypothetical protein